MLIYTNQDPETPEGWQLLMTYYFSQSYADIKTISRWLYRGKSLTPQPEVLVVAFKVYKEREEKKLIH